MAAIYFEPESAYCQQLLLAPKIGRTGSGRVIDVDERHLQSLNSCREEAAGCEAWITCERFFLISAGLWMSRYVLVTSTESGHTSS